MQQCLFNYKNIKKFYHRLYLCDRTKSNQNVCLKKCMLADGPNKSKLHLNVILHTCKPTKNKENFYIISEKLLSFKNTYFTDCEMIYQKY